jgi:HEAT repeat protein
VLAQSGLPEAQRTIVQVARAGPEGVRLAAVRELGRFGGSDASKALLQIYDSSNLAVKRQVVRSLGDRADVIALQRIALSEVNAHLRDVAIVTLGTAGGRDQLRTLYSKVPVTAKRPIIVGLFNAGGEDELIRIAEQERDSLLRQEVLMRLRLLGTPKARAYLEKEGER